MNEESYTETEVRPLRNPPGLSMRENSVEGIGHPVEVRAQKPGTERKGSGGPSTAEAATPRGSGQTEGVVFPEPGSRAEARIWRGLPSGVRGPETWHSLLETPQETQRWG